MLPQEAGESAAIAAFMRQQGPFVVLRALTALSAARDEEVAQQLHRIAGTVGSYGFHQAAEALRELEATALAEDSSSALDAIRAAALDCLRHAKAAVEAVA